jgi:flagellar P-ring protein precursor FlgI
MTLSLRCSVPLSLGIAVCLSLGLSLARDTHAARVKDLTSIAGVRDNQLIGYGLVVGLNGTGDGNNTGFSSQTLSTMLRSIGPTIDAAKIRALNAAVAIVTATLPPFARAGGHADVLVSSMGDAKSLQGDAAHPPALPMARSML